MARRCPCPPRLLLLAAAALCAALLAAPARAQLPDKGTCVSVASGQQSNINALAPCVSGPTASCCSTIGGFAGPGTPLFQCLCYPDLLEQLLSTVESNSLAQRFGVTRSSISTVLQACGVPHSGGTGNAACPSGAGPSVAVTAPGTTVGVAPGGQTTVTAPGTTVNAGPQGTQVTAPGGTSVSVPSGGAATSGAATSAGGGGGGGGGGRLAALFDRLPGGGGYIGQGVGMGIGQGLAQGLVG
ncbi:hypothetical protein GPECTOR_68g355 [Gonium pectorale]|uniref:Bifunctional inhibitor/plant lipid transfer protein/seed storage helical domain-containing protein n=1 Tax=Gonium pectorale TaxID=33097 RepID=A0A150G3I3_GONPE|nr:hypothetical protein GPECTOR_68g355 [Gonium pectorale]|eukprot:KXZ44384.1 hypothetical protein GPECTOR_68g355 [Gonium pectorale]